MLEKQVQISKVTTLADGTIRLIIDLLNSKPEDIYSAYEFREIETTMVLAKTADMQEAANAVLSDME